MSAVGDPLEKLNSIIPWPVFEKPLAKALKRSDGSKGVRPPFPAVLMFKILVLRALYNLSDDQASSSSRIGSRLCLTRQAMLASPIGRFLGLGPSDKVPDAKTIWLFRKSLVRAGAIDNLFARFDKHLSRSGYLAKGGQIIDATIIQASRQHNSQDEKEAIKSGEIPETWKEKPAKLAQKDRDAPWTVKYSKAKQPTDTPTSAPTKAHDIAIPMFGYNNHAGIDRAHGFIRGWTVTSAAAHDGAQLRNVVTKDNTASTVWADSAYRSKTNEEWLQDNGLKSDIHQRKPKGKPMPEATSRANGRRSRIRATVEHVFARQKDKMKLFIRTIGIGRAKVKIGMPNIAYNMLRYVFHEGRRATA
ncbi:IS5 family transposase [Rhizobium sp. AQ_MP]|uniref:IS5 family transposase n=1 Tax=Rhizobium sp. AQ_MP TaxID=2761536 RepID=UPI001FF04621|nr:IS5 family transposase [Rhizobium sp. AQ_MP]